jgi:hypothetical protein
VKLFDEATVGNTVLQVAEQEAAWLLKAVCVEVTWIFCPVITVANRVPCGAPVGAIEVHILPSPLAAEFSKTAMGIAVLTAVFSGHAAVFLSRVRQTAESEPGIIGMPELLGHVMAHEIGHLLLRSSAHSSEGLMRADFRPSDLKKAAQRRLRFTLEQTSLIQERVLAQAR